MNFALQKFCTTIHNQTETTLGMHLVEKIKDRLSQIPSIKYMIEDDAITVFPANNEGFEVSLHENDDYYLVNFGGWHEVFKGEEEAMDYFTFGLSSDCRLQVHYRGDIPYRWVVQAKRGGIWKNENKLRQFFAPFWRKQKVMYLQNHMLPSR